MDKNQLKYWMILAHLPGWRTKRLNEIIVKFQHGKKLNIEDLFNKTDDELITEYEFTQNELDDFNKAKSQSGNYLILCDNLIIKEIEAIPVNSEDYPDTLKNNMKLNAAPPLIYIKGNKQILKENSVAIVGSRNASDAALKFTDNLAKKFSKEFKVIVSGFAKGVDKQALDSALKYIGQSIVVLPQGILTFEAGFREYDKYIKEGNMLVLSIFYPKAPWNTELAMARNTIIYGLAEEIFAAESNDKGGTWNGVLNGLRAGRNIYVRFPADNENNANLKLIQSGAIPVDIEGNVIENEVEKIKADKETFKESVIELIRNNPLTSDEIVDILKLEITPKKFQNYLKTIPDIISFKDKKKKRLVYTVGQINQSLF